MTPIFFIIVVCMVLVSLWARANPPDEENPDRKLPDLTQYSPERHRAQTEKLAELIAGTHRPGTTTLHFKPQIDDPLDLLSLAEQQGQGGQLSVARGEAGGLSMTPEPPPHE